MPIPETVTHLEVQDEPLVSLQGDVRDSARRHIKSRAVTAGKTIGEYITDLLVKYDDYEPPAPKSKGGKAQS